MKVSKGQKNVVVILNNIRSNENVGSIFRTADAFCVSKIYLCGYTPAPQDRFGRENRGLTKASLGAEKMVPWEKIEDMKELIERLKIEGFKIVGIEQDVNSINIESFNSKIVTRNSLLVLIFGNEVDGLSSEDLKLCDYVVEIPMRGKLKKDREVSKTNKESLNVAVTAGVILSVTR
jgi:23S rRNA (guanosine2251-2'-O)-methyltransferase